MTPIIVKENLYALIYTISYKERKQNKQACQPFIALSAN